MGSRTTSPATPEIPTLTQLARRVHAKADESRLRVNLKQLYILRELRDTGSLPQNSICIMMRTTANTVVAWLNELEAEGFVERVRDPDDRRKHNVALTRTGLDVLENAERYLFHVEEEVLSPLTPEERTQLRKLVAKALV
ncbi:MarR family transcriptional regulator [Pendulispora brunnea]|uniref:MarR family transcriptional regulator n=1 Tax=Pendulispora brunnea TaxID=2905690 RepID=A0ABZ2KBC1_9BACT